MDIIKEDVFRKQIKKGLSGGYLFYGEEDYMKMHMQKAVCDAVCADPAFALFNHVYLDALTYTPDALVNALMAPPMMCEQKAVIVSGLSLNAMRQNEIEDFCDAVRTVRDYDYNILIVSIPAGQIEEGTSPKRPSAILTKLGEVLTPVLFESISGARLVSWVAKHFEFHGATASPEVCSYLIEYSGKSMYTLSSETEKLSYYVLSKGRREVTREDVRTVSVPVIANDAFALANAILDGKYEEALNALGAMKFRRTDPIIILSEVSRVICDLISVKSLAAQNLPQNEIARILKMNEYKAKLYIAGASSKSPERLKRALSLCTDADLALKLSPQGYQSIEKLICSL